MGRIDRSEGNLFPWPKGAYIRNKRYLYINVGNMSLLLKSRTRPRGGIPVMTASALEFCRIRNIRKPESSMPTGIIS